MNKNTFDDAATWNTFTEAVASEWLALNRVAALLSNALALHAVARLAVAAMGRREITPFERSTYDELLDALRRIETQLSERNAALSAAQTAPPDDLNRQMERLGAEYKTDDRIARHSAPRGARTRPGLGKPQGGKDIP